MRLGLELFNAMKANSNYFFYKDNFIRLVVGSNSVKRPGNIALADQQPGQIRACHLLLLDTKTMTFVPEFISNLQAMVFSNLPDDGQSQSV